MALDITKLEESTITTGLEGKILAWYGTNNTGKSYVASHIFPGQTLWLATEKGYNAIAGMRLVDITSWKDFRDTVSQLTITNKAKREKVRSMYKCVVVDVADKLPDMVASYVISQYNTQRQVAAENKGESYIPVTDMSGIPFGGGYATARKELDAWINKLALSGYLVVLIFHDEEKKLVPNAQNSPLYTFPKNTFSKAGNALKDIPDFMIYLENQGEDEDGNPKLSVGHCVQHTEFFARSRFTQCPPRIEPFTVDNLKETVRLACEREAELQGVKTIDYATEAENRAKIDAKKKLSHTELIDMINPVFKALYAANYKAAVQGIVEQYLGEGAKVSQATENQVEMLQCIYDNLVDLATEKEVEWE